MSTRIVGRRPRAARPDQADLPFDNVTPFPGTYSRNAVRASGYDDESSVRTIDAIADHVLAARYLSAEEQDGELNRLLDLLLLHIGRTIAALDGPESSEVPKS